MFIQVDGKFYQISIRRRNGEVRIFFKTDSELQNEFGFVFTHCNCKNRQHRLECWKKFKRFIAKGGYSGFKVFPVLRPTILWAN